MQNFERRYDLDWLRVLAVVLLIYFHTAVIFYRGELGNFYVTNSETSFGMGIFISFVHQWHMPLFFFLSGVATWFSLEVRTVNQHIRGRFQRLFIPFLFGTLILVPPQVYFHQLQASSDRSYFQFYPQFFNGIRPRGNFEWAHLWFIVYLFVFSLVALPLFLWLKGAIQQPWYTELRLKLEQGGSIFYLALPLVLIEALLRPRWIGFQNLYDDWANVFLYLTYFIYGYIFGAERHLWRWIDRQKTVIISTAILGMSLLLALWLTGTVPQRGYSPGYLIYQGFRGFNAWCWVVALLSLGRSHLNFSNSLLKYANEAAYPFYLLHQSVIVSVGFYVVQWQTGIPQKFILISAVSLCLTLGLYELLIRRTPLRVCFGLKPLATATPDRSAPSESES